ncbi:MAG: rhamnogalacturonan acetylesterase [Firmicutes bacterium]|nr:rhamnogalacturonan acetylesterase [Bacillota bacterium]
MRMVKSVCGIFLAVCLVLLVSSAKRQTTVFVIGDSTAAEKDISKGSPERGWGMMLQGCFSEDIVVDNHARNGRSSRSFIDEGLWQKVLDRMKPGDYVLIQFGHNDEKHDREGKTKRFAKPGTTFDANLERYVRETREKGGIPVLLNCVERRLFYDARLKNAGGKKAAVMSAEEKKGAADDEALRDVKYGEEEVNTEYLVPTHFTQDGDYTAAPYIVARKLDVPFVDANRITHWIETEHGVEGSRRLHMWLKPGEVASIPDGRKDNTHYNIYGARIVANRLADALADAVPALKDHVRHYDYVVSAEGRGDYLTLDEAVSAVPEGKTVTVLVLDGTFKKPQTSKNIKYEVRPKATLVK